MILFFGILFYFLLVIFSCWKLIIINIIYLWKDYGLNRNVDLGLGVF